MLHLLLKALTLGLSSAGTVHTCDVTKDPDVKYFDFRVPEMPIPAQVTTYVCYIQPIPLPRDKIYHAVAFEPMVTNKGVTHHMILFRCREPISMEPGSCYSQTQCSSFMVQWSTGIAGQICSYPDTGVRFGHGSFQALSLQIHLNNLNSTEGLSDSSGMRVYYTTRLRKLDVGNVQVGQNSLHIPPGVARLPQTGSCSSACTTDLLTAPIYLTRAHIHMHYVGEGGVLQLIRPGQAASTIVNDTEFDYMSPPYHHFDKPVQVLPGDELKLTCFYNTRDGAKFRNRTLLWSEGSDGEMCYAFITYFPHMPLLSQCIQDGNVDICFPAADSGSAEQFP